MEHSKKRIIVTTIVGLILFALGVSLLILGLSIKRPKITFYDADGVTVIGTESVAVGKTGGTTLQPTKESELPGYKYTFVGWNIVDEETGTSNVVQVIEVKEDKPIKAVAVYNRITLPYEINYNTNGGTLDMTNVKSTYNVTQKVELPTPTKKGYNFAGWYSNATLVTAVSEIKVGSTGRKTFYAKWTPIDYPITYDLNGGTQAENPLTQYNAETVSELPIPHKDGFTFGGWYDQDGNHIEKIVAGMNGSLTLKARWINKISYNLNGGFNPFDVPTEYELNVSVELPRPVKYGYIFLGWCMNEDLSDETKTTLTTDIASGVQLYAKWELATDGSIVVENGVKYMYFGRYPQSVVCDYETIKELDKLIGGGNRCTYDGFEYVKVMANPLVTGSYEFNGSVESLNERKEIVSSSIISKKSYYFKVLPIKWRVVSEESGTVQLLSEYALAAQTFGSTNNYSNSNIRKWLNETFLNDAFNETEKQSIKVTAVDNSSASTASRTDNQYACETTNDRVYLMSYKEVTKVKYGYISSFDESDPAKFCATTEYARAVGAKMNLNNEYFGYTDWMLRSPFVTDNKSISVVRGIGKADIVGTVERWSEASTSYAVRPMITIELK